MQNSLKINSEEIKLYERRYGIVTQDLKPKTVNNVLSIEPTTLQNYLAKINIKLGGLNYSVKVENAELMNELENTLFIALDINHPGSKSIVDRVRVSNEYKSPGVLGYAANYGQRYDDFLGSFL